MRSILALIEIEKHTYSQLPLFEFIQDETIDPLKRFSFCPCSAPFIMGFSDLCKYSLRQEPTTDKLQIILNQHSYEDDFHWQWFLEDMHKLGFNSSIDFNHSLEFLWGDATKNSRLLLLELHSLLVKADTLEKLIIMEAMEATADVFLSYTKKVTDKLKLINNQEYQYFGNFHIDVEHSHDAHSHDVSQFIKDIYVSDKTREQAVSSIEKVFELFTQWTYSLLNYAENYQISEPLEAQLELEKKLKVA